MDIRPSTFSSDLAFRAVITAGILGLVVGMIPLLGTVLIGVLAVYLYRRRGGAPLTARAGSRLGAAAGAIAAGLNSVLTVVRFVFFHVQQEKEALMRFMEALGVPASQAEAAVQRLFTPAGLTLSLALGIALSAALAAMGGAIAAAIGTGSRT